MIKVWLSILSRGSVVRTGDPCSNPGPDEMFSLNKVLNYLKRNRYIFIRRQCINWRWKHSELNRLKDKLLNRLLRNKANNGDVTFKLLEFILRDITNGAESCTSTEREESKI